MLLALLERLSRLRLWLSAGAARPATVTVVRETIAPPPAPAVAGFVLRLAPPADFHLAARLASVAHLNTKAGRIPASGGKRATNAKVMPKLQPATRKRSPVQTAATRGPTAIKTARSAQVVPMQKTSGSRCVPLNIRIQQAA